MPDAARTGHAPGRVFHPVLIQQPAQTKERLECKSVEAAVAVASGMLHSQGLQKIAEYRGRRHYM